MGHRTRCRARFDARATLMTPSFWICGELTGEELWMTGDGGLGGLVHGIIRRYAVNGLARLDAIDQRRSAAVAIADQLQERLIDTALRDNTWVYEEATDEELDMLCHLRGETLGSTICWNPTGLALVFVPTTVGEATPAGRVFPIRWATDRDLLASFVAYGFLKGGSL